MLYFGQIIKQIGLNLYFILLRQAMSCMVLLVYKLQNESTILYNVNSEVDFKL